jgi:hypothetical protein
MQRRWHPVDRQEPCPICGKPDWCSRSRDGAWVACRRLDTGGGLQRVDKAGVDYWLYCVDAIPRTGRPAANIPVRTGQERANPDTLNDVYRALLALLPLAPRHRQNLCVRGLSDGEIIQRHFRTLPVQGRADLARPLVDRFGPEVCARVPGLYIRQKGRRPW